MTEPGAQPRVVVADDDADIRQLVEIAVRKAGFELLFAAQDGDSAWDAILEGTPDLAVLDVSMPGFTGFEICRLVRAEPALDGMRILLLSAAVDEASRATGLEAGADGFMMKPFSPKDLSARLIELMSTGEAGA